MSADCHFRRALSREPLSLSPPSPPRGRGARTTPPTPKTFFPLPEGGEGPPRRPQKRLDGRLEEVAKAVGGGYCRLQMPLKLALAVGETVAGRRLGALQGGEPPPFEFIPDPPPPAPVLLRSALQIGPKAPVDCPGLRLGGPALSPKRTWNSTSGAVFITGTLPASRASYHRKHSGFIPSI